MSNKPKFPQWYLAEILEEVQLTDIGNRIFNNWVLVQATSAEDAYRKSLELGDDYNQTFENEDSQAVTTIFRGLKGLSLIPEKLEHGAEIAVEDLTGLSETDLQALIPEKNNLSVFHSSDKKE